MHGIKRQNHQHSHSENHDSNDHVDIVFAIPRACILCRNVIQLGANPQIDFIEKQIGQATRHSTPQETA